MVTAQESIPAGEFSRLLPPQISGWQWVRRHVLATRLDAVLFAVLIGVAVYVLPRVVRWAFVDSVWLADQPRVCASAAGACWAVITAHARTIVFGLYPYAEQWRPGLALAVVGAGLVATFVLGIARIRAVVALWIVTTVLFVALMGGGVFGLQAVPSDSWGGLPLSILVFMATVVLGFPLAIVLALARRSSLPAFRLVATAAIEVVRSLPILTILFTAAIVIPLALPDWLTPGKLYRVTLAMALFYACFQAEIIRGGLQGVPVGQVHAALSLGLTPLQTRINVELPQALGYTVPATISQIVVALKDTAMLLVVGIFDFLASANTAITRDEWSRYFGELYMFVALVFLILTSVLIGLERRFVGTRRHS
jgi:general L-amino acid transport system permease protein